MNITIINYLNNIINVIEQTLTQIFVASSLQLFMDQQQSTPAKHLRLKLQLLQRSH